MTEEEKYEAAFTRFLTLVARIWMAYAVTVIIVASCVCFQILTH